MKTLKCTRPKLLISLATVNLQSPGNPAQFDFKDKNICLNLHSTLRTATRGEASLDYWENMRNWGMVLTLILIGRPQARLLLRLRSLADTVLSSTPPVFAAHSKRCSARRSEPQIFAPRCLNEVEDATHVWQCQDPRAINVWTQAIANLEVWMQKQRTQPGIIQVLCAKLLALQRGSTEEIPVGTFHSLPAVVQKQDEVGWQSLLEGRPSLGWSEVQQRSTVL
jgi:hypothetical protein